MKAALFLVLFILFSSFRHDIHYSFHSSEGETLELQLLNSVLNLNAWKFSLILQYISLTPH